MHWARDSCSLDKGEGGWWNTVSQGNSINLVDSPFNDRSGHTLKFKMVAVQSDAIITHSLLYVSKFIHCSFIFLIFKERYFCGHWNITESLQNFTQFAQNSMIPHNCWVDDAISTYKMKNRQSGGSHLAHCQFPSPDWDLPLTKGESHFPTSLPRENSTN